MFDLTLIQVFALSALVMAMILTRYFQMRDAEGAEHRRLLAGKVMIVGGRLIRLADDSRPLMFLDDVTLPWNRPEWSKSLELEAA